MRFLSGYGKERIYSLCCAGIYVGPMSLDGFEGKLMSVVSLIWVSWILIEPKRF